MAKKYISKYTGPEIDSGLDNIPKLEGKLTELEKMIESGGGSGTGTAEIYIGDTEPTDENIKVWINPDEEPETGSGGTGGDVSGSGAEEIIIVQAPAFTLLKELFPPEESKTTFTQELLEAIADEYEQSLGFNARETEFYSAHSELFSKSSETYNTLLELAQSDKPVLVVLDVSESAKTFANFISRLFETQFGLENGSLGTTENYYDTCPVEFRYVKNDTDALTGSLGFTAFGGFAGDMGGHIELLSDGSFIYEYVDESKEVYLLIPEDGEELTDVAKAQNILAYEKLSSGEWTDINPAHKISIKTGVITYEDGSMSYDSEDRSTLSIVYINGDYNFLFYDSIVYGTLDWTCRLCAARLSSDGNVVMTILSTLGEQS